MSYRMMTAAEAIDRLFALKTKTKKLDFTFDDLDLDPEADISGWYGARIINVFDENPYGFFVMGYYGGGSTEGYDIYGMVDDADDIDRVKDFMTERLQSFMNTWCDSFEPCEKICVEIK